MDDVVSRARVSRPLFYRYFSSIRELRLAALRSVTDGLIDRLTQREEGPPMDRLRAAVRGLIEVAGEYRAGYVALLRSGSVVATSETNAVVDLFRHRAVEVILTDTGVTEPSPLLLATLRCWTSVVEGSLLTWLQDGIPRHVELDRWLVDQLVAMVTATAAHDPAAADLLTPGQSSFQPSTSSGLRGLGPT